MSDGCVPLARFDMMRRAVAEARRRIMSRRADWWPEVAADWWPGNRSGAQTDNQSDAADLTLLVSWGCAALGRDLEGCPRISAPIALRLVKAARAAEFIANRALDMARNGGAPAFSDRRMHAALGRLSDALIAGASVFPGRFSVRDARAIPARRAA
jgi:hypothetical protein